MSITRDIYKNLNEAEAVKKPYGDKPQEGKTEKTRNGKGKAIPSGKTDNKVKADKLDNVNSQAADIYPNDTEKNMDKVDSKEQSDKGKAAKTGGTKSDKTIKFPFGDKVQASDSKLIKEGDELEDCGEKLTEGWMDCQNKVENTIEEVLHDEVFTDTDKVAQFLEGIILFIKDFADEHDVALDVNIINESAKNDGECYACGKIIKRNGVEIGGHMYHPSCGAFLDECGEPCKKEDE